MKLLQHEPSPVCGKSSVKKGLRAYAAAAPFVLPGLLLVLAFVIYPMFFTIRIALSEYRIVQGEITFTGLENFKNVLSGGSRFWYAYRNNFLYALVTVPFILLGGMLFAYLINNLRRGQTIFRVGFYLPVITSWVIVSLVFQYMFNNSDRGLINYLLVDVLHVMDDYVPWLLREWSGNAAIWLMGIWKNVGWSMLVYLAALQGIPKERYEAAELDGAGPVKRFFKITLPYISPTIQFLVVMGLISSFQYFTQAYVFASVSQVGQSITGGPQNSLLFYSMYLYMNGFSYMKMGYASAMAIVLFLIVLVVSFVAMYLMEKRVTYDVE